LITLAGDAKNIFSQSANTCYHRRPAMSAGAAGASSAAAAAEQQRRMREEEEEMTPYSRAELSQDWEFKILRSATAGFRNSEWLRRALEEEARAGWMLLEKFDNGRIRLKRPASARERDGKLNFDPYRTFVGPSPSVVALTIVASILGIMLVIVLLISLKAR
jgi:hypothetical protein